MPESTLQELRDKLRKANDDYHEIIGEILVSEHIVVRHKVKVGAKADMIFSLMNELNKFLDSF